MKWITTINDISDITQGSIVDGIDWGGGDDNPVGIVLSNACDIENDHASYIIVAAMYPASDLIAHSREYKGWLNGAVIYDDSTVRQKNSIKDRLSEYIHHKKVNRYYFIDCRQCDIGMLMMVDFQQIKSIAIDEKSKFIPIATLDSPLKEQMIMQFVSYTARIPSDRVSEEEASVIINTLIEDIREIENGLYKLTDDSV